MYVSKLLIFVQNFVQNYFVINKKYNGKTCCKTYFPVFMCNVLSISELACFWFRIFCFEMFRIIGYLEHIQNLFFDLFQDILINIWNGLKSYDGDKHLSTWIWRVSLNTCINYSKKKKRELPTLPLDVTFNLYEPTDEDSMQIRQLYDRINKLGFIDRSIILMWLENMSYEDIGAILGITANNVSVKLVRIREKLKQM